jgi:hypothetical protein
LARHLGTHLRRPTGYCASWQTAERWIGRASAIVGGLVVGSYCWFPHGVGRPGMKLSWGAWSRFLWSVHQCSAPALRTADFFVQTGSRLSHLGLQPTVGRQC